MINDHSGIETNNLKKATTLTKILNYVMIYEELKKKSYNFIRYGSTFLQQD